MLLGEKLRRLRIARQLSQEQLADKLQVSRQTISKWELGESIPDTENLILLSKFYGVSIDYLLLNKLNISSELETKRSRISPIFIFGMGGLIIGLILSIVLWCTYQSILMVSIGLIIQIISVTVVLIKQSELSSQLQRLFLMLSVWMIFPFICFYIGSLMMNFYPVSRSAMLDFIVEFIFYLVVCTGITVTLKKVR
ncbi:helix-turn-helix transcriptional regulator [Turicibacter bilis]|uniref:helix-turn-helix domain-containing protein n=1 Tax=Turicibacter bilis TaxID=2735723 RepID=UPI0006C61F8E|nr:helix-turn-helix transcriptional regulator [Turicibacter bilis]MBS3203993.1 helix-turn-helix transcriptional regulator [Turicibacter bilis]UUF09800.1 helix-turn-helix transcriptional regulator [Turicibacter bilis]CUO37688.1 HTH-type transcriptional regulator immR [Turicibacter sanguinis]